MNATLKKTLIGLLIAVLAVGAVFGIMTLVKKLNQKPVNVYPMSYVAENGSWYLTNTAYGTLVGSGVQRVYTTSELPVTTVLVEEGQTVEVGDVLAECDPTIASLTVKKAEIELAKLQLELATAQQELAMLKAMRPFSSVLVVPENTVTYTPHETPYVLAGTGVQGDQFVVLWGAKDVLSMAYLNELIALRQSYLDAAPTDPEAEAPADDGNLYVAFITRQDDALNAPIVARYGVCVKLSGGAFGGIVFYEPQLSAEIEAYTEIPQPYYQTSGSGYSAAELASMRVKKQQEISELEIKVVTAQLDLEAMTGQANDGYIRATVAGTVKAVRDIAQAKESNQAVVEVSSGAGYVIQANLSEFDRQTVVPGQTVNVTVYDWSTGSMGQYEGTVLAVDDYPDTSGYAWTNGNGNVSYYPFTIAVDDSAIIGSNGYIEVTYSGASGGADLYLYNAFIRTEGGRSYVYVLGEDDRLEQRFVTLGADLWGSYTQITSGLTMDDYIAFPYGSDVVPGAKTVISDDMSTLYGY